MSLSEVFEPITPNEIAQTHPYDAAVRMLTAAINRKTSPIQGFQAYTGPEGENHPPVLFVLKTDSFFDLPLIVFDDIDIAAEHRGPFCTTIGFSGIQNHKAIKEAKRSLSRQVRAHADFRAINVHAHPLDFIPQPEGPINAIVDLAVSQLRYETMSVSEGSADGMYYAYNPDNIGGALRVPHPIFNGKFTRHVVFGIQPGERVPEGSFDRATGVYAHHVELDVPQSVRECNPATVAEALRRKINKAELSHWGGAYARRNHQKPTITKPLLTRMVLTDIAHDEEFGITGVQPGREGSTWVRFKNKPDREVPPLNLELEDPLVQWLEAARDLIRG